MENPVDILIVEDSPMQAKRLRLLLEQHGYKAMIAYNGREGLQAASNYKPSLIVSDVIMPVLDGYEMCRILKRDEDLKHIPIVLLTSLSNPQDVFLGLESGADSYVSKPFQAESLLARIESVLAASVHIKTGKELEDLEIVVGEKRYVITSSRHQILNLLLSTYQDAVEQNRNLREMRTKLVMLNERLETLVAERTASLRREIAERKRTEQDLASEKERLSVTLRSIGDGVITTDTEGKIVLVNRAAEDLTGWPQEETVGKSLTKIFDLTGTKEFAGGETVVQNILKTGALLSLDDEIILRSRNGLERTVAVSGTPIFDRMSRIIGAVLVFRDITERKKMEEERTKAQKLESVGILAGGIAHDFNNLLTAILGNVTLAKMSSVAGDKIFDRLEEAEKASLRAKNLTHQLLTFSKGGAPLKKTASVAQLLRDSVWFALSGSNVRCDLSVPNDLWMVEVDEGQISQVIHNLVINADQAMPEGGTVKVYAENAATVPPHHSDALSNDRKYVRVSVQDEGIGIAPEHLSKVFDPYFTTKQKGSGLGLASCYSILRNHDGFVTVESDLGTGTTFHVYLPAVPMKKPAVKEAKVQPRPGKGTVLVMDDEEILRTFLGELLDLLGYEVEFACHGLEAIDLYCKAKAAGKPFDCVLMDLTIPGAMGGKEAIQRLLEIDPNVKAIVSSGYSDDPVMAEPEKHGFIGVVAKPYDAHLLGEVIHRVITDTNRSAVSQD
ncbi:MAG: response regulator [Desulfomonilaceae bacterium]